MTLPSAAAIAEQSLAIGRNVISDPLEPGKADLLRELSARGTKPHEHQKSSDV